MHRKITIFFLNNQINRATSCLGAGLWPDLGGKPWKIVIIAIPNAADMLSRAILIMDDNENIIETHPWTPFVPDGAKALIMGTFPPGRHRWAMDFFYPNPTNDFWRIMGLIYHGDLDRFYRRATRSYDLPAIKALLAEYGIAMGDTGHRVRRLRGNASDKYLEILEPVDLEAILERMPDCRAIATAAERAAAVSAELTGTEPPAMGRYATWTRDGREIQLWRLPSTSRAYPLAPGAKAGYYRAFLESAGCM